MTDIAMEKKALRRKLRARRRGLSLASQRRHAALITAHVARTAWFCAANRVALYMATDGEVATALLLRRCRALGKQVYLPRIRADLRMEFAPYYQGDSLKRGHFGTLEPLPARLAIHPTSLDVVFTPLVGFTSTGVRLGMGGGFYDRCFGSVPRPKLVGIAHSCQREELIPSEPWDTVLMQVMTERGAVKRQGDSVIASLQQRRLK
ncbi:MAG: 5-formyltetrahydrofolate cyclo-ligase [Pseudomonadota bacterium]